MSHRARRRNPTPRARLAAESTTVTGRREAVREVTTAEARTAGPGRMYVQLIRAGWSANGRYYPAEVLRRDGAAAFPAGTHAHIDHATDDEVAQRPSGSLQTLAAVQTTDAAWDEQRQALTAEVRLFHPWRETLTDMAEHIGMSIRAWVTGNDGSAEGRNGFIVDALRAGESVDFVTRPAAGGAILAVLESLQSQRTVEARNVGAWLESRLHLRFTSLADDLYGDGRLTREERLTLSGAVGDALAAFVARLDSDAPQLYTRDIWDEPPTTTNAQEGSSGDRSPTASTSEATTDDPGRVDTSTSGSTDDTPPPGSSPPDPGTQVVAAESVAVLPPATLTDLADLDSLLPTSNRPTTGRTAGGSPPTAPAAQKGPLMSGTESGARAPDNQPAGATTSEARTTTTDNGATSAAEAALAVARQEARSYADRAHNLAEALTEARNAQRTAEAERDRAVAETRRLRGNEAGRTTVDRLLTAAESGVPEHMVAHIGPRVHAAVLDRVPTTDTGEVDTPALEALVASVIASERVHAARLLEAQGVGRVQGLGAEGDPTMAMTGEQFARTVSGLFTELGLDQSTADLATKGR